MNTGFLYTKMFVTIVITLYTTRIILHALGEKDYGIFQLTAGVIMMLSFINSAMAIATQRYMSYYHGANEEHKLKAIFNSSVVLHLFIGFIIILILEVVGVYLFGHVLNIPPDRIDVAKKVFQFMVVSTFFTINAVPYDAAINAHENMLFDALMGIFESLMKLMIALIIVHYHADKLVFYGLLIASLTIVIRVMKSIYCSIKYEECKFNIRKYYDWSLIKEMFSFASWNFIGTICNVVRNQGISVILNVFLGVVVNAAYGISQQIDSQLSNFSINLLKAINPQIAKSEGGGDRERMIHLAKIACKFSVLLFLFFAVPLIIEMKYVLQIWLHDVPENTVIFCQLVLTISLIQMMTSGLMLAIQSVGKIRGYMISVGVFIMMNIPVAYVLLKLGFQPYTVLVGSIIIEILVGGIRIWFAKKLADLNTIDFLKDIIIRSILSIMIIFFIAVLPSLFLEQSFVRLVYTTLLSTSIIVIVARFIALTSYEFNSIKQLYVYFMDKIKKKN